MKALRSLWLGAKPCAQGLMQSLGLMKIWKKIPLSRRKWGKQSYYHSNWQLGAKLGKGPRRPAARFSYPGARTSSMAIPLQAHYEWAFAEARDCGWALRESSSPHHYFPVSNVPSISSEYQYLLSFPIACPRDSFCISLGDQLAIVSMRGISYESGP